jgi:hypothetical protein
LKRKSSDEEDKGCHCECGKIYIIYKSKKLGEIKSAVKIILLSKDSSV